MKYKGELFPIRTEGKNYRTRSMYFSFCYHYGGFGSKPVSNSTYVNVLRDCLMEMFERAMDGEIIVLPYRLGWVKVVGRRQPKSWLYKYKDWVKTREIWKQCPERKGKDYEELHFKRFYQFEHRIMSRYVRNRRIWTLLPVKPLRIRIFNELTLNKTNRLWQNNIYR